MWIKLIIGLIAAAIVWYVIRESLISLDLYLRTTSFGKKIINKPRSKYKFRDPLAARK
jgi:hypothetical protein